MQKYKNHGFAALLGLLIVIVIGALIYMIDMSALFGLGKATNPDIYAERPWFEEQRLVDKDKLPVKQTGKGGKVIIYTKTILAGDVVRKDEKRGQLEIVIEPNGFAQGHWQCEYQYAESKTSYTIKADFAGNIDPTKIYEDKKGKNKKLLYFITKGKYEQVKTDSAGAQWPSKETIYVVGWIDKDFSARGKIFLMTDDKESHGNAEYDWTTK